ncbi:MAG: alpha-E domain-containing protein [Ilumatobacteraceae bacterium]
MALLARVADRLYWAARYTERAEDTARIVRSYGDLMVDMPSDLPLRWEPLVALIGSQPLDSTERGEREVMEFLIADESNPSSVAATVGRARDNLRTTREVVPREAWSALNGLHQYVSSEAERAAGRRSRDRFLGRVIDDSRRLDGVLESSMTRAHPYWMWRLGRLLERADMTTRVVGLRAASILQMQAMFALAHDDAGTSTQPPTASQQQSQSGGPTSPASGDEPDRDDQDEVQWMSALRSVSALQMYQRATHGPIEGPSVVRFLLYYSSFPRSVQGCLDEMRAVLAHLPGPDGVVAALDEADAVLASCDPGADDGAVLDDAMEAVQASLATLGTAIDARYLSHGE